MFNSFVKTFIGNFAMLFRDKPLALGRWNRKHSQIYMDWGNLDNCYSSSSFDIVNKKKN